MVEEGVGTQSGAVGGLLLVVAAAGPVEIDVVRRKGRAAGMILVVMKRSRRASGMGNTMRIPFQRCVCRAQ